MRKEGNWERVFAIYISDKELSKNVN
jgi:hypothetical protein